MSTNDSSYGQTLSIFAIPRTPDTRETPHWTQFGANPVTHAGRPYELTLLVSTVLVVCCDTTRPAARISMGLIVELEPRLVACTHCYRFLPLLCKRHVVSVCSSVCRSVCLSATFVNSVKTNKHVVDLFSSPDSQTILVFPLQTS